MYFIKAIKIIINLKQSFTPAIEFPQFEPEVSHSFQPMSILGPLHLNFMHVYFS